MTIERNKIIVNPDIHGRKFWKTDDADETFTVFVGDYLDPYPFENITVEDAIPNFKEIIEYKKQHMDNVVLLLGNHDMPYFSDKYYHLSRYHSRHSNYYHKEIQDIFLENKGLFKLAVVVNGVLITHAGVNNHWLTNELGLSEDATAEETADAINKMLDDESDRGMRNLYMVSWHRGGYDNYASCVWMDVHEMTNNETTYKQIFGHTLQARYDQDGNIIYDKPIIEEKYMMLDNTEQYTVDLEKFSIVK